MIVNEKELFSLIETIFNPLGYVKKKETWYFQSKECICFFTIGKSFYSGKYGQAFGCFLRELNTYGNTEYPGPNKSHLRISLRFFTTNELVDKIFNLEERGFVKDERELAIKDLATKYAIPFLHLIESKEGIKEASARYPDLKYYMKVVLKEALGMNKDDQ